MILSMFKAKAMVSRSIVVDLGCLELRRTPIVAYIEIWRCRCAVWRASFGITPSNLGLQSSKRRRFQGVSRLGASV